VPLTFGQEISGWSEQIKDAENAIIMSLNELYFLPLGGTAVGTGINCPKAFTEESIKSISNDTNLMFYKSKNNFSIMASHDRLAQVMSQIKILAGALFKISNDIKILSSGPRSGIYELIIPQNEPGSSILPGKVNPTHCEALSMDSTQIMGLEYAVSMSNSSGTLQMNEYKPLIGFNILTSLKLGQLIEGEVLAVKPYGFFIDLGGASGLLHQSSITNGSIRSLREIFREGEIIKALISEIDLEKGRIGLNTALLENSAGELIIDKQKVMQEATERALKTKALFDKKEQDK